MSSPGRSSWTSRLVHWETLAKQPTPVFTILPWTAAEGSWYSIPSAVWCACLPRLRNCSKDNRPRNDGQKKRRQKNNNRRRENPEIRDHFGSSRMISSVFCPPDFSVRAFFCRPCFCPKTETETPGVRDSMSKACTNRREWFRTSGRWTLATLLTGLSTVLVRRRWQSPCNAVQPACGQCIELQSCRLPLSSAYREALRQGSSR